MRGDVEPERLLLEAEQLVLLELVRRDLRVVLGRGLLLVAEVEDRALAGDLVGLRAAAPGERLLDALEHPAPSRAGRVERAAFDERLERALVRALGVDALGEVPERLEGPPLLARGDDRPRR